MVTAATSLLIPSQLPQFIRDNPDYSKFVAFVQAYYEWMETTGGMTAQAKNILNYDDIDKTTTDFINYYINDFLPYFPEDALVSKARVVKLARQLYQSKGTPASYQFLFRVLYNSDAEIFYTRDNVLRASDGIWFITKSVKLSTIDPKWLSINNYRLFGETTKTIATIENSVLAGNKTEVFVSNIERLFQSGEFVRVVDNNNQDVLFGGNVLRAKIVGQISQITINPNHRGLLYQPGNPVVVYGGLNSPTGVGAKAVVGTTTSGSIQRITVLNGGFGYRPNPNTIINIQNAPTALAIVGSVDTNPVKDANVSLIPQDTISFKKNVLIGNTNYNFSNIAVSNANTTLLNALSFLSFTTYPISSVIVENGGGGITKVPVVSAESVYPTDAFTNADLETLGILAPIQIINAGTGYAANDKINFVGGTGYGVSANVVTVDANGAILTTAYVNTNDGRYFPLGGMGYTPTGLPTLTVSSANGANAVLTVTNILGTGATFTPIVDRIGAITSITLTNNGEDYIATPNVSLVVQDIAVSNVSLLLIPDNQDTMFQGANINTNSFQASVDSITLLSPDVNPANSVYSLRVYNYTGTLNPALPLVANGRNIHLNVVPNYVGGYSANGSIVYGDGTAQATASFKNGLVIGQGTYLTTQGQLSSFSVLESEDYNNFTYRLTVEKEIAKYRDILLNLLHPTGTKVIGVFAMKSQSDVDLAIQNALNSGLPLPYYTGANASTVTMTTDFTNKSNNIIVFGNLSGANIAGFLNVNTSVVAATADVSGYKIRGTVVSIDTANNTATLRSNTWLTYGNVANITANAGSNTINIKSLTGTYNIINMGVYSDPTHPLKDIVFVGDSVLIANNTQQKVTQIDYTNGVITVANNWGSNANSTMAVARNFVATGGNVVIYGPVGVQYFPSLTTEAGEALLTESGSFILLD